MDFKRLCEIRDAVMQIDQLSQQLQKENKHNGYKSPRIVKDSRSTNLSNPTESKALRMAELSQQIEDKKDSIIPDLKQAAAYIDKQCGSEHDASEMVKLYFVHGQQLWQLKKWSDSTETMYDPVSTLAWFFRLVMTPEELRFYLDHDRLPEPGEI